MKKLFIVMLCMVFVVLCACGTTNPEETTTTEEITAKSEKPSWVAANPDEPFAHVIEGIIEEQGSSSGRPFISGCENYVLYSTDDTKALLLGWENPNGYIGEIYTFQDGIAERKLSIFDEQGECAIKMWKTGAISTGHSDGGAGGWYRFENGQLKLIAGLGVYGDGSGGYRVDPTGGERDLFFSFNPDGTEIRITADEYNGLWEELVGDLEPAELDWKPLAEYGR